MNKNDSLATTFAQLLWSLKDFKDAQYRESLKAIEDLTTVLKEANKEVKEVEW